MSSALPYMKFYVADYLGDTMHLSTLEHGAYLLLLMNYWRRGEPLPAQDEKLARITKLSVKEWLKIKETIAELFVEKEGQWTQKRIERELDIASAHVEQRRNAGATSAQRKAQRKAQRNGNENPTDVPTTVPTSVERPLTDTRAGLDLRSQNSESKVPPIVPQTGDLAQSEIDFRDFWETYPKRCGTNSRAKALERFGRIVKAGTDPASIIAGAAAYAAHCDAEQKTNTEFVQQTTTWLNERGWETEYVKRNGQAAKGVSAVEANHARARAVLNACVAEAEHRDDESRSGGSGENPEFVYGPSSRSLSSRSS